MKNVDTPSMEDLRAVVVEQELSARSWRAHLQKMQDTIAIFELQERYDEVLAINQKRLKEQQEKMAELMASIQNENGKDATKEPELTNHG